MKFNVKSLTLGGVIAALYVVLTLVTSLAGFSSGIFQIRFSEILCILPCFTFAAVPGLFIGCILANLISGAVIWDIVFGSLATLIGAIGTYIISKKCRQMHPLPAHILSALPPIVSNTIVVPLVLAEAYGVDMALPLIMLLIFASEIVSVGILGYFFSRGMSRVPGLFN